MTGLHENIRRTKAKKKNWDGAQLLSSDQQKLI